MEQFSDILLQVKAMDADTFCEPVDGELEHPVSGEREFILRDLVVLRHVRVKVVLPGEATPPGDFALEGDCGLDGELHDPSVQDRQDAGHPQADRTGLAVRGGAEGGAATAKDLGSGQELGVNLQPDDRLEGCVHGHPQ
jgi:hypothetical protein